MFVSPCLDGFLLAVGGEDGPPGFLEGLGGAFSQVQFFATHRVTEYHHWGKYAGGTLVRDYCYCGESGEVLRDEGDWTAEEIALGFGRFPRKGREEACEDFPGEKDVLDIAAAWGVDPRFEKTAYPPSTGWLCT